MYGGIIKKAKDFLEGILWRNGRCNGRLQFMTNYNFITFLLEPQVEGD